MYYAMEQQLFYECDKNKLYSKGNSNLMVCFCDHRMCNNIRIEDELGNISEFLEFDVEVHIQRLLKLADFRLITTYTHRTANLSMRS
jgi:hypothetical protein